MQPEVVLEGFKPHGAVALVACVFVAAALKYGLCWLLARKEVRLATIAARKELRMAELQKRGAP